MNRAIPEQLGISSRCAILALVFRQIPQGAEVCIVGEAFSMRDLLQARSSQQAPDEIGGALLLLVGLQFGGISLQRQQINHLLPSLWEPDRGFRGPAFLQAVEYQNVVHPVVDAAEAITHVFQHGDSGPGEHLRDVLHYSHNWYFKVPVEIACSGVVECECLAESYQRVRHQPFVVLMALPEVDEEIVPKIACHEGFLVKGRNSAPVLKLTIF